MIQTIAYLKKITNIIEKLYTKWYINKSEMLSVATELFSEFVIMIVVCGALHAKPLSTFTVSFSLLLLPLSATFALSILNVNCSEEIHINYRRHICLSLTFVSTLTSIMLYEIYGHIARYKMWRGWLKKEKKVIKSFEVCFLAAIVTPGKFVPSYFSDLSAISLWLLRLPQCF